MTDSPKRRILTGEDVQYLPDGSMVTVEPGTILTDIAREWIEKKKIRLESSGASAPRSPLGVHVAIGSDHGGFDMKQQLRRILDQSGIEFEDHGTFSKQSVDYPDIAQRVGLAVATGEARLGILIDGAGIGSALAANKIPGVRAGACLSEAAAKNGREHNDLNVMTLGSGLMDPLELPRIVHTFINSSISEPRHRARVQKIIDIERKHSRPIE